MNYFEDIVLLKALRPFPIVLILLGCLCAQPFSAWSATVTSVSSGNWSSGSTWSGGSSPASGDSVIIDGGNAVTVDGATALIGSLNVIKGNLTINAQLNVARGFYADLRSNLTSTITGSADVNVGGDLIYVGESADNWQSIITLNNASNDSLVTLRIAPPNGASYGKPFHFPKLVIAKPDTSHVVRFESRDPQQSSIVFDDSLYYTGLASGQDTIISIRGGTLNTLEGLIYTSNSSITQGPFVYLSPSARYQTSDTAKFPSSNAPIFICDSGSTIEYYTSVPEVIDVTYLLQNVLGHSYYNIRLTGQAVAAAMYDTLRIRGNLYIAFMSMIQTNATTNSSGPMQQQAIEIRGDVINDNRGASGSINTGIDGDGFTPANETWIFDGDTSHWSGPGEVNAIDVKSKSVLSVRYFDDRHCDSILFLDHISEEGAPCGGHIIGRIFTKAKLDSINRYTDFGSIGLTIQSGDPVLGETRVVRTAGYIPPGADYTQHIDHAKAIKRYFNIVSENGPQYDAPNHMRFYYHCDELNNDNEANLFLWRSTNDGSSWAYSGRNPHGLDVTHKSVEWDTLSVGYPTKSNNFLWTLFDHAQTDSPLPVELQYFTVSQSGSLALLSWQTNLEVNSRGFEVTRLYQDSESVVASWKTDPLLIADATDGASYQTSDAIPGLGLIRYDLYEVSQDGIRLHMSSQVLNVKEIGGPSHFTAVPNLRNQSLALNFRFQAAGDVVMHIYDECGRLIRDEPLGTFQPTDVQYSLSLAPISGGLYFVILQNGPERLISKVLF